MFSGYGVFLFGSYTQYRETCRLPEGTVEVNKRGIHFENQTEYWHTVSQSFRFNVRMKEIDSSSSVNTSRSLIDLRSSQSVIVVANGLARSC